MTTDPETLLKAHRGLNALNRAVKKALAEDAELLAREARESEDRPAEPASSSEE